MNGHVYILVNSALPNLVKIGRTTKTPKERASELSSTGTPGKFIVAYSVLVSDCSFLEKKMHEYFSSIRHSNDREFFEVPVQMAIDKLIEFSRSILLLSDTNLFHESNEFSKTSQINYNNIENIEILHYVKVYLARLNKFTFRFGISYGDLQNKSSEICNRLSVYFKEIGAEESYAPAILYSKSFEIYGECREILNTILENNVQQFFENDLSEFRKDNYKLIHDGFTLWNYKSNQTTVKCFFDQLDSIHVDITRLEFERLKLKENFENKNDDSCNYLKVDKFNKIKNISKKFNI
jgi:hypothetical protein